MAESTLRVSAIIPAYNSARDIAECIGALQAATFPIEIIVVDDASEDDTGKVARKLGARVFTLKRNSGPAAARNFGARHALGEILFFVDADVVIAANATERMEHLFATQARLAAVFGSYDAEPRASGLISQYRNLLHHFVHQSGNPNAATFWAGCGAIRKSVFEQIGGFDEKRFVRPSIEDIELGYRLRAAGFQIRLDKSIQGTHLKRWRFGSMLRTDILQRAIPWSRLILETKHLPDDLNLKSSQRVSFLLALVLCLGLCISFVQPKLLLFSAAALVGLAVINRDLYKFFLHRKGFLFAAASVALHTFYYVYSGFSYAVAWSAYTAETLARSFGRKSCTIKSRNFRVHR